MLQRSRQALADGDHRQGLEWAEAAWQQADGNAEAQTQALSLQAQHLWRLGRFEDAAVAARDAAAGWQALGRPAAQCDDLCLLAMAYSELGLHEPGLQSAGEAFELARRHGLAAQQRQALNRLGICHERLGDPAEGERLLEQSLELARAAGSADDTLLALNNLMATTLGAWHLYRRRGENAAAADALQRAIAHGRAAVALSATVDPYRRIVTEGNLGEALGAAGAFDEGERLLEATIAQARQLGYRVVELRSRHNLGELRAAQGRHDDAVALLSATLDDLRRGTDHETTRMRVHAALWHSHKALGHFEPALAHCEAYHAIELQRAALQNRAQVRLLANRQALEQALPDPPPDPAPEPAVAGELLPLLLQAHQRRKPLALAALEVDHAAALVGRFGAGAVDAVLREIAQLVRLRLRSRDLALRWNSQTWLVVLADTPPAAAAAICERLRAAVEQHDWGLVAPGLQVTLSLGLVTGVTEAEPGPVLQRAEAALQRARQGGHNRVANAAPARG